MHSPGTMIQQYKVVSQLGKGGMGEVYKCEDQMLGRFVAIKELSSVLTTDANFVQRFRQEAQLQAKLSHPHIVGLYSFFEEFGQYYMVMEYAEGKTLKDLIREIGPIPEKRALNILKQILDALEYAHSKNIIHRDIKPVNIILEENDQVKILDFGIARMLGEKGLTQTGQQLGTVTYMSPEQVKALKDIDARSDIYSLGVTLFEMLSGRLPYDTNTDSDYDIMNQIVQSALPDPRSYYPHITEHTVKLLTNMLVKERDNRYGSAKSVMIDLVNEVSIYPPNHPNSENSSPISGVHYYPHHNVVDTHRNDGVYVNNAPRDHDELYGIKGWLLLLCIGTTILSPILSLSSIIEGFAVFREVLPDGYKGFMVLAGLFDLFNMALSMFFGTRLWRKIPGSAKKLSNFFIVRAVVFSLLTIVAFSIDETLGTEFSPLLFQVLLHTVIWCMYLAKSKRVRVTIPK